MRKVVGTIIFLLLLAFGLPVMIRTIESLILPTILFTVFIGLGIFLVGRKRLW
jgi:hypothetical protein